MELRLPDFHRIRFAAALLAFVLAAPVAAMATPWPKSDIPADPAVTFGVLSNGMRYAIMHNATPSGQVSVRLRIGAGSMQEKPEQRGLAHFVEHMAFRGSTHVADGEINRTLERLGLRFGADTNASTGQEETIYRFDLPRSDDATVDTALGFMREIASELKLDPAAAKTEAGVVLSELKLRDLASFRALQAQLDFILRDEHATALANGDPAVVARASVELMRAYYQAYYRPDRATLIVVGDIDPAALEAKIRTIFGNWQGTGTAGRDPKLNIPLRRSLEAKLFTEEGAPPRILLAWLKSPDPKPDTTRIEKQDLVQFAGLRILNRRLSEQATAADRPFTRAAASIGQTMDAVKLVTLSIGFDAAVGDSPDEWKGALAAAEASRLAILKSGVTQDEVDRVVSEIRAGQEASVAAAATRPSTGLANGILSEVGDNNVYSSPQRDLEATNAALKDINARTVSAALRDLFGSNQQPLIFMTGPHQVESGEEALKTAWADAQKAAPAAVAAAVANKPWPYTSFGAPGAVVETQKIADLDVTMLRFANGVGLTVRPSKLRANQVLVSVKVGGGRLDLPKGKLTAAWAAGALTSGGLKAMSFSEMQRSLTPKVYRVGFGVGEDGFIFSGRTTPDDLDTQMQVLTAYMREPGYRSEAFEQMKSGYAARLRQIANNPAAIMQMKSPEILHDGDKRWASPSAEESQAANVDELRAMLTPAFANGAIDVTIVGDISVEQATKAVAATFGALPQRSAPRAMVSDTNNVRLPGNAMPITIPVVAAKGVDGQAIVSAAWPTHGRFPDIADDARLQMMTDIMEQRLFDRLRGLGTVYVAQVGNTSSKVFDYGYVQALAQLLPSQTQQFNDAVREIADDLKAGKITDDDLARARNPALEELRKSRETNEYWLSVLDGARDYPVRLDLARKYEAALKAVTAADVVAAASKYLTQSRMLQLSTGS